MAELKTKPTALSAINYLNTISDPNVRQDCFTIMDLMERVSGFKPTMWGPSIVGFGKYHYKYDSGHEGDICLVGFSPRKQNISLYVLAGFPGQAAMLMKLGKHKAGKGCLFVKRIVDIDLNVLESLIKESMDFLKIKYASK
jgi:hypothetical protein